MKLFAVLAVLFSINTMANDAIPAGLKVLGADYNPDTDSVEVEIKYKGGCNDSYNLRLRGCADLIFPYTCQVDVVLKRGEICENDMHGVISFTRDELKMKTRKFSKATLIIQDPAKKTQEKVLLPFNK